MRIFKCLLLVAELFFMCVTASAAEGLVAGTKFEYNGSGTPASFDVGSIKYLGSVGSNNQNIEITDNTLLYDRTTPQLENGKYTISKTSSSQYFTKGENTKEYTKNSNYSFLAHFTNKQAISVNYTIKGLTGSSKYTLKFDVQNIVDKFANGSSWTDNDRAHIIVKLYCYYKKTGESSEKWHWFKDVEGPDVLWPQKVDYENPKKDEVECVFTLPTAASSIKIEFWNDYCHENTTISIGSILLYGEVGDVPTITQTSASGTEKQKFCVGTNNITGSATIDAFVFKVEGAAGDPTITPALCNGLRLSNTGGGTYQIAGTPDPNPAIERTQSIEYTITVKSASGVEASLKFYLTLHPFIALQNGSAINNTRCSQPFNGSIEFWPRDDAQGEGPYQYSDGTTGIWSRNYNLNEKYKYVLSSTASETSATRHYIKDKNGCQNFLALQLIGDASKTPTQFNVTGGGAYCEGSTGVSVGLEDSERGFKYTLYKDGVKTSEIKDGTGYALDFGLQKIVGEYTVKASNDETSCSADMTGKAVVSVNAKPTITVKTAPACSADLLTYSFAVEVSEGTVTCNKGTVTHSGNVWTVSRVTAGQSCTATVTITSTGCSNSLSVSAPNCNCPVIDEPTGATGGEYCAGSDKVAISVDAPAAGYEIHWYNSATGGTKVATGASFIPTAAGTYYAEMEQTVSSCTSSTRTAATLTENPLPSAGGQSNVVNNTRCAEPYNGKYTITATGGSSTGYTYSNDGGATYSGTATHTGLQSASVTARVKDSNGCESAGVSISVSDASATPTQFTVTGTDSYCAGGAGVEVKLDGSESGVKYTLYKGGASTITEDGTGSEISFGKQTAGTYTIKAEHTATACTADMTGSAVITENALPTAGINGDGPVCKNGPLTLTASDAAKYNWNNAGYTADKTFNVDTSIPGDKTVTLKVMDANGCESAEADTKVVLVKEIATAADIQVEDKEACKGSDVTLTASTGVSPNPLFTWYSDASLSESSKLSTGSTYSLTVTTDATYYVSVQNEKYCENIDADGAEAHISVKPTITNIYLHESAQHTSEYDVKGVPTVKIALGAETEKSLTVEPSGVPYTIRWYADDTEFDGLFPRKPYIDVIYKAVVTDDCNTVLEAKAGTQVEWPTIFMPYDGGANKDFVVDIEGGIKLYVYDRTGNTVTVTDNGWDGTSNGKIVMPGVYYYKAELPDGSTRKGTVEVAKF